MASSAQTKSQVAAPVAGTPAAGWLLQRKCACGTHTAGGGECGACGKQRKLQRRAARADERGAPGEVPPVVNEVLGSQGHSLDAATRSLMESRFGHDFSRVRVHTDARAAESARAVHALAYTVGNDLVFGAGRYAPGTGAGRRLLAHELTHVVQQRAGASADGPTSDERFEREADAAAHAVARGESAAWVSRAGAPRLQRFEEGEHHSLGNEASGTMKVNVGGTTADTALELEFGDVVMLSGDWFSPDELKRLASTPGDKGRRVNTRDEVLWAIKKNLPGDPRFAPGGIWADYNFSEQVKAAVDTRFNMLAGANAPHYAAPRGRNAAGVPNPGPAGESNAGATYHDLHESAIRIAYQAGGNKGDVSQAMAREAAAQHFLSDAFSAGHVRTSIGDMRSYWNGIYPLFWYNLLHKMALDTATRMNSAEGGLTYVLSVQQIYEHIMEDVNKIAGTLPELTLGDLLAKVFHDYDNVKGIEIGGGDKVYGDNSLDDPDTHNVTRRNAVEAMKAGIKDVQEAFDVGASGTLTNEEGLYNAVRKATGAPAGVYVAETKLPRPDPSLPGQNWKAPNFETLWLQPFAGTSGPTVGQLITDSLAPGGKTRARLDDLAKKFPPTSYGMHPQRGYLEGFVAPLVKDPRAGILGIINWAPTYGLSFKDRDDISVATGEELRSKNKLGGMTTPARVGYIRELISGAVFGDEEELVVNIFETAPPAERPRIYQLVEGHPWKGDWVHGVFVSDDDIWNALRKSRLNRLRGVINQGWSGGP